MDHKEPTKTTKTSKNPGMSVEVETNIPWGLQSAKLPNNYKAVEEKWDAFGMHAKVEYVSIMPYRYPSRNDQTVHWKAKDDIKTQISSITKEIKRWEITSDVIWGNIPNNLHIPGSGYDNLPDNRRPDIVDNVKMVRSPIQLIDALMNKGAQRERARTLKSVVHVTAELPMEKVSQLRGNKQQDVYSKSTYEIALNDILGESTESLREAIKTDYNIPTTQTNRIGISQLARYFREQTITLHAVLTGHKTHSKNNLGMMVKGITDIGIARAVTKDSDGKSKMENVTNTLMQMIGKIETKIDTQYVGADGKAQVLKMIDVWKQGKWAPTEWHDHSLYVRDYTTRVNGDDTGSKMSTATVELRVPTLKGNGLTDKILKYYEKLQDLNRE
ncbi:hypothetical protein [Shewanella surugensis]|uniref:Uncharacterized protein n=1 Tax=Shewanella surugensis TaxID=212020 RepID=A0ABT0L680_9GAMM|nr:hypothetical protein [Shewanella surugensis]MCL1123196.1 hypothetical protein [Shewanella surugensis]